MAPLLDREGFAVVLVEFIPRSGVLRLFVERCGGEGVTLDDCAFVSRMVGDVLDGEGVSEQISGRYTLEVSSPGLDRPLVKPKDFSRFVGREIRLATCHALNGRRRFRGSLSRADDVGINIEVDGCSYAVAYAMIDWARLVPAF